MTDERMAAIAAALAEQRPDWPALTEQAQKAIAASADAAPEMTDRQRRRIGRLLRPALRQAGHDETRGPT